MQKLVFTLLIGSVVVGSVMPSRPAGTLGSSSAARPDAPSEISGSNSSQTSNVDLGSGTVMLERAADGHFYAEAQVNGMPVTFLVDTGASGIALTREDARRAGIAVSAGEGEVVGSGASGEVRGEFVTLERVGLGIKEARNMNAAVLYGGDQSLLGQSFLSQFGSVSIEGDTMVLR
jgi:aspartyl protease family protein